MPSGISSHPARLYPALLSAHQQAGGRCAVVAAARAICGGALSLQDAAAAAVALQGGTTQVEYGVGGVHHGAVRIC